MLAGGQSLIPMLKLRFASPEVLVDINNISGLDELRVDADGTIRVGALCRHADLERSSTLSSTQPTMAAAAPLVADPIVRNRGTLVGSLCHADPQGDWASVVTALGGHVVAQGSRGRRTIPVSEFVTGPFQNVLAIDEIVVEAVIPAPKGVPAGGYLKLERRVGDFATAGVAVALERSGEIITRPASPSRESVPPPSTPPMRRGPRRRPADRGHHRPGGRPGRAGGPSPDRPPGQRGVQAAHRAHLRGAPPQPRRRVGGEGGLR